MSKETEERLRETLHAYKKSEIDGDELTVELAKVLGVDDALVVHILEAVFPEFRALVRSPSMRTLMTGWFMTLHLESLTNAHPALFS
jgi:O-phosphoseryl-tRNA synthetase